MRRRWGGDGTTKLIFIGCSHSQVHIRREESMLISREGKILTVWKSKSERNSVSMKPWSQLFSDMMEPSNIFHGKCSKTPSMVFNAKLCVGSFSGVCLSMMRLHFHVHRKDTTRRVLHFRSASWFVWTLHVPKMETRLERPSSSSSSSTSHWRC
ncbi:hypothetical protein V8G54_024406 [Vigna mungo]|uniref:Uncharacterized protein n=1 Tax=Vigna mungo TaxID=3915 RepID=A0AAQ3N4S6_VIGMU